MRAEFVIHGKPRGKERPRVTMHCTYTPKNTRDYEMLVRSEYGLQCRGAYFGGFPIRVEIQAYFVPPNSVSKKAREEMLLGKRFPAKKPDADNIAKVVCDALNGYAWNDDAQVVCLFVTKLYGANAQVKVRIQEVEQ